MSNGGFRLLSKYLYRAREVFEREYSEAAGLCVFQNTKPSGLIDLFGELFFSPSRLSENFLRKLIMKKVRSENRCICVCVCIPNLETRK